MDNVTVNDTRKYVIGLDFGSLSGRALLVDVATGEDIADFVVPYAHGIMSECLPDSTLLPLESAVQHPRDYLDVLSSVVRGVLEKAKVSADDVIGVGVDFTAATVLPVDEELTPLCFREEFVSHPKAYATMWKDHTAAPQAALIDRVSAQRGEKHLGYLGGKCSAENGLAKVLAILQTDEAVYSAAHRILEAGDWITMLISDTDRKGYNFAASKEFWNPALGGYPSTEFMKALDPRFENVVEEKFGGDTVSYEPCCGFVSRRGAELTGLREGTAVAIPYVDGYCSMPASGVITPGKMSMVIGTSLCHFVSSVEQKQIPGLCASVYGLMYPNYTTHEGGQSSCGDLYQWFIDQCLPESYVSLARERNISVHALLREKLAESAPGSTGLICLDWFNGNRSVLSNADLSGMIVGLTLQTKPEEIYRALLEATAFGTRRILEQIVASDVAVDEIIASGGIASKDALMMQILADVTGRPIRICASAQAAAHSTAMFAAVAAGKKRGGYDTLEDAAEVMVKLLDRVYVPNEKNKEIYNKLYEQYLLLHDFFGKNSDVMKRLREIRNKGE